MFFAKNCFEKLSYTDIFVLEFKGPNDKSKELIAINRLLNYGCFCGILQVTASERGR